MAALRGQLGAVRTAPIRRNRADAAFAMAAEMDRNELPPQVKQAMEMLSDGDCAFLKHTRRTLPHRRFPVTYRHMLKVLHLLSRSADEQTRQIHRMLLDGIGPDFSSETRVIGAGEWRDLPTAVFRLRQCHPDLTYAWGIPALIAAVLAGHSRVLFSPDRFAGPQSLPLIRSIMSRRDVTFISPTFTQQRLAISKGINPEQCRVIQPGVDFGRICCRGDAALRYKLGLTPDDCVLIAPGESTVQTAHDQAIWTCGILHVLDPKWKLLLAGTGPRADTMRELGHRFRQPDLVKIAGPSVPYESLLSIADICLVTAAGGAPTLPIATAMAAGVPIISTVTYMLAELLEDRHTALMVPRRSPRSLAQRVQDLQGDPALAAKLVETARAEAYEHFSMTRMLEEYRSIFVGGKATDQKAVRKGSDPFLTV